MADSADGQATPGDDLPYAPHGDEAVIVPEAHRIADNIAQFALQLTSSGDDQPDVVRLIIEGALKLIPGTDYAGVVASDGTRRLRNHLEGGEQLPGAVMDLQNHFGEGPCIDAISTERQTRVDDLTTETRWPAFSAAAAKLGVIGMLSTPMVLGKRALGSLTLIATTGSFDEEAGSLARIFAAHASIALSGVLQHHSLLAALSSRDVIGQAKGILMERFRMTPDVAFAALVKASADNNLKLRAVCEQLCATGVLATRPAKNAK